MRDVSIFLKAYLAVGGKERCLGTEKGSGNGIRRFLEKTAIFGITVTTIFRVH